MSTYGNSEAKKAAKMFRLHVEGNAKAKEKAEKWFDDNGTWVTGDKLKQGDYDAAQRQFATSFDGSISNDDLYKWRKTAVQNGNLHKDAKFNRFITMRANAKVDANLLSRFRQASSVVTAKQKANSVG